jgi:hypothetical protein
MKLLAGKVCFYYFMCFENKPVDKALEAKVGINTRYAWAGGNFFQVVLLCQFLVLAGNRFWLYILLCTWSTIQLWCCVSFFVSGGK